MAGSKKKPHTSVQETPLTGIAKTTGKVKKKQRFPHVQAKPPGIRTLVMLPSGKKRLEWR